MPVLSSEAVILRTWPVQEADLIVSFFTRDYGKMRGVAKSALRSRRRFGGALEPMTVAQAWFAEKPRQELARLDQLEIVRSPLAQSVDPTRLAILSFYAELLDEALPERDPQEAIFRLLLSVLDQTSPAKPANGGQSPGPQSTGPWMPLTYFSLWMTRLMGLLPDLAHCIVCGEALHEPRGRPGLIVSGLDFSRAEYDEKKSRALAPEGSPLSQQRLSGIFYSPFADGLFCEVHRTTSSSALAADSWQLAQRMLRQPVAAFAQEPWPRRRAQDLRRFTLQALERHLEKKLRSAEALARLGG
ncbi:MAG: DNA repair protein RecO [Terracidiphilus sp.]